MSYVHCKPPLILFILSYFILRWQLHKLLPCKPHNPPTLTINYDHLLFTRPALFIPPFFLGSILTSLCYINPQNLRSSQYLVRKFISNQYFHKPFVPYTNPKFHELYTAAPSRPQNGFLSSLPFLTQFLASVSCGVLGDWLLTREYITVSTSRKMFAFVCECFSLLLVLVLSA